MMDTQKLGCHFGQPWSLQTRMTSFVTAGKKKSTKEKRELRKARKKDSTVESTPAARKATPEELAAAGARLGPRAQVRPSRSPDTP